MKNLISETDKNINFIKEIVAAFYKIDSNLFNVKSRKSSVTKIKHVAIYIAKKNVKIGCVSLGKKFDVTHGTVLYIIKKFEGYITWDKEFKKEIDDIQNILNFKTVNEIALSEQYYYIPLNNFVSIKQDNGKAIILKGFSDNEIEAINFIGNKNGYNFFENPIIIKKHENKNLYILEKENDEKNNS